MGGKKTKLTDWPDNLKDVIDWFLRVGGKDKESLGDDKKFELPKAVNALGDYGEAKNVLESGSIAGNFGYVADGLRVFIGYNKSGSQELKGDGVGLSSHGGYASSYKDSAKWDGGSSNPTTYAHILLGSFPLLYYGLTHLLWRCTNGGWQNQILQGDGQGTDLSYFMNYMGYNISQLKSDVNGTQIATLLVTDSDSITDLKNFCNSASTMTYPDFLQKLHQKGTVAGSVMNAPLYKLYTDSHAYLTTNWKSHMLNDIPQTKAEIEATLTGYSEAVKL
ncbi:variant erythrocyte surface antigen-1 family protein [Babesia caballi]|uniref:Variant erythrocyte surface antigen-1 family protein n=1 Tax=Babesia caballi TaxID=5871 RepID=A0AAV4M1A4_BABCB|nr:variant erythrocyte surface antigen-1 family protein [Babesia caballi]